MERYILVAACILFIFSSCGQPHLDIIRGNYAFLRGDFQKANITYLEALKKGSYEKWIAYNLGNVYYSLGEHEAALKQWNRAASTENKELIFNVVYNRGILYYEQGEYEKAFRDFKRSVEIDPSNLKAKINLEYALQKMNARRANVKTPSIIQKEDSRGFTGEDAERILDYVERKEKERWESSRRVTSPESASDW
ncbi:MAG: hypothetical protein DRP87_05775 [Spirochaetes bacterium]|nr:MAG: hypothetical protein DRP87_05775 [Spirochaetota bacterium]